MPATTPIYTVPEQFYFSPEDSQFLKEYAEARGMRKAQVIRELIRGLKNLDAKKAPQKSA